ncbi:unnamed protein product [Peniophora sp. CBMAI 1063]|nr:unnamed protein product [Peniophora sp. CBMAI 1063]
MVSHKDYSAELSDAYPDRGYPIADPQPGFVPGTGTCLPQVDLGDVGYIQQSNGRFVRLFNVHKEPGRDGQPDLSRLPAGFEVLNRADIRLEEGQIDKSLFKSNSVTQLSVSAGGSGCDQPTPSLAWLCTHDMIVLYRQSLIPLQGAFSFRTTRQRGAILVTPGPARIITIDASPRGVRLYKQYAVKHLRSWIRFFEDEGLTVDDLVFVTGVDLTASWANAVFTSGSLETSLGLDIEYVTVGGIRAAATLSWTHDQAAMTNSTPLTDDGPNVKANQAIFIRRIRAKRGILGLAIKANAEPRDPDVGDDPNDDVCPRLLVIAGSEPDRHEDEEAERSANVNVGPDLGARAENDAHQEIELEESPQRDEFEDSLTPALDYILERSSAQVALVHDLDIPMYRKLLSRKQDERSSVVVDGHGIGMLRSPSTPTIDRDPSPESHKETTSSNLDNTFNATDLGPLSAETGSLQTDPPVKLRFDMKCDFPPGANICKRCSAGNHHCGMEGRTIQSALSMKPADFLAQMRRKDSIIARLIKQQHNPYLASPLSIAAYRVATPDNDPQRQNVIAWLDQLPSSLVVSEPLKTGFHRADDASDYNGTLSGSTVADETAISPDVDLHSSSESAPLPANPSVPIGALAQLALSLSYTHHAPLRNKTRPPASASVTGLRDGAPPVGDYVQEEASEGGTEVIEYGEDEEPVGIANAFYFESGPSSDLSKRISLINQAAAPDLLVHGLVTPEEVNGLFQIFHTRVNPFVGVLDPVLHTPSNTFSRSPFLFTVVCAIALRYSQREDAYLTAMHFAKNAAAQALVDGWKSIESCQAYILMSIYSIPARRWEEDRSWLYTGLAIRLAMDLNLYTPNNRGARTEAEAREFNNRTRVWIICYNLDQSTATLFGKPSTLKEDQIVREGHQWYNCSPNSDPFDIHLVAYSSLMGVLTRFHAELSDEPYPSTGLKQIVDFRSIALKYDQELEKTFEVWTGRFQRDSDHDNPAADLRCMMLPFYVNYSRLVVLSFAFQQAFERGFERNDEIIFTKSLQAARMVVNVLIDSLAQSGYLRYAPDGHFAYAAFASAFMLKLLRPECRVFSHQGFAEEVYSNIERLVHTIAAPAIAIDETHTPRLYSDFLGRILAKHRRDAATAAARVSARHDRPGANQQRSGQERRQVQSSYVAQTLQPVAASVAMMEQQPNSHDPIAKYPIPPEPDTPQTAASTSLLSSQPTAEDVLRPRATDEQQTGADSGFAFEGALPLIEEDTPAPMKAISHSRFWGNFMMPGQSWPAIGEQTGAASSSRALNDSHQ